MATIPYNSQLDAFELYHRIQEEETRTESGAGLGLPALGHALAGSAGTAISHLILYPLDLSITRLQVQKQLQGASNSPSTSPTRETASTPASTSPASLLSIIRTIYKTEGGLRAFYAGCALDTAKSIVDAFLFFLLYTYFRTRRLTSLKSRSLGVPDELRIGIQAGLLSKLATTPISQLVTRRQVTASSKSAPPSLATIARQIYRDRGPTGFWAGYRASVILTLNPALTFLFQNMLARALLRVEKRKDPGPRITFLIAAVSKAAASAVMYPFSLAKTRAQLAASGPQAVDAGPVPGRNPAVEKPGAKTEGSVGRAVGFVVEQVKKPSPVVQSLKHVYATEGLGALYAGLEGEVLKGFLGHGLTMLLKERIHVAVVAGYFLALKVARRGKDGGKGLGEDVAEEMGKMARVVVNSVGDKVTG